MLTVHTENIGDLAIVECKGRIVRSEAAFKLRKAVMAQTKSRVVVLDMREVHAIEGGGLGMLRFLQRWALDHGIQLTLFDLANSIKHRLQQSNSPKFNIATFEEMMALLACADSPHGMAA
jgi:anti-anti-sigma regulatory factor